jgi:hypothetical protein
MLLSHTQMTCAIDSTLLTERTLNVWHVSRQGKSARGEYSMRLRWTNVGRCQKFAHCFRATTSAHLVLNMVLTSRSQQS